LHIYPFSLVYLTVEPSLEPSLEPKQGYNEQ
jgi:hypothetical protein